VRGSQDLKLRHLAEQPVDDIEISGGAIGLERRHITASPPTTTGGCPIRAATSAMP